MKTALTILNNEAKSIPNAFEPWKAPNARALDRLTLAQRIRSLPVSLLCMLALDEQLEGDNGVPTSRQNCLGVLAMIKGGGNQKYWDETETHRCAGGNVSLAEKFVAELESGNVRIHKACEAETITIDKNRITVKARTGHPFEADDVILAIPPSGWPGIRFSPKLPPFLKPQKGQNVKFLMGLKNEFWTNGNRCGSSAPIVRLI